METPLRMGAEKGGKDSGARAPGPSEGRALRNVVQDAANHPDVISSIAANACLLPTRALREGCEALARLARTDPENVGAGQV